ncbi:flap endonuclease Xni, partial [Photobacterium damselae]
LSADFLAEKWHKKILGNEDLARACKQGASLKSDLELGFNLQDIRYTSPTE